MTEKSEEIPAMFYQQADQRQRVIDWDKVVEFNDLKELFKALRITIYQNKGNDQFTAIEHLFEPCDPWPDDDAEG